MMLVSKKELRQQAGISASTLRRYLNILYRAELARIGYSPTQKLLTPEQYRFLRDKLVIIE